MSQLFVPGFVGNVQTYISSLCACLTTSALFVFLSKGAIHFDTGFTAQNISTLCAVIIPKD